MTTDARAVIICLNGFRRGVGPGSGLFRLYRLLCHHWYDRRQDLLLHRTCDSNPAETADLIAQHHPRIIIAVTYSYGAGWGLTQLVPELARRATTANPLTVDHAMLISPVTRYRLIKWRSLTRGNCYRLPEGVREATVWRQVNKMAVADPVGQQVKAGSGQIVHPETVMGTPANLNRYARGVPSTQRVQDHGVRHQNIDGYPSIHGAVIARIDKIIPPPALEPNP